MHSKWLVRLDQTLTSYSLLFALFIIILFVVLLERVGILDWVLGLFGRATRWSVRCGFRVWEYCLSWANWWVFLLIAFALLTIGGIAATRAPLLAVICSAITMAMGVAACSAYMFIDVERYEVERGRKAVHNPTKGQDLAPNVAQYGQQVEVMLLAVAATAVIGGFALLNQAMFESIGRDWYRLESDSQPVYVDFLAYAIINLLSLVDVLDIADSKQLIHAAFVRKNAWPAATTVAAFRLFFTMIILQQVFASVRQGRLLSETIADFWSPHEPIHHRARNTLPQFGAAAIAPILASLRTMTALNKEQRDQLPIILAAMGPSTIPILVRHLNDSHEHVRAVAAGALGHLRARETVIAIEPLVADPSDLVRVSAVESLGLIIADGVKAERLRHIHLPRRSRNWKPLETNEQATARAVDALIRTLTDPHTSVRAAAAISLGRAGAAAYAAAGALATLLQDADETVRCNAAEAAGQIGAEPDLLAAMLQDPSAIVRAAAARGLKLLGRKANGSTSALIALLQDHDETVRAAAGEALAAAGPLDDQSTIKLTEGLSSPDNMVRAQAAEALGTVDVLAEHAAPCLVEALTDRNDVVRAKAVEALGKIGEAAAELAVPSLVRALHDRDSWVSALAAEALGEMGTGEGVVQGLVRALNHLNPQVRANSAEALGKLGVAAASARNALERAAGDDVGEVRSEAIRALGSLGPPRTETAKLVREALADPDPHVRIAAASAIGSWEAPPEGMLAELLPLLHDPNEQVRARVCELLSKQESVLEQVVEGLCSLLTADDSIWVQTAAAMALARIGPRAAVAGPTLLRASQTGEAGLREQAMRALVMIQPPEAIEAFEFGLSDGAVEVRLVASAGWIKAATVPASVGPILVEALRDPEPQVRANAAYALSRLDVLPTGALSALLECVADINDGMRLNAALALRLAPPQDVEAVMIQLLEDPNVRVRLVAADAVLRNNPTNARAATVVITASEDPNPRVRQAVENLLPLLPAKEETEAIQAEVSSTTPEVSEATLMMR